LTTARSEFRKLNSVTQKKSTDSKKDKKLDDLKTTPTETTVMGAMLEIIYLPMLLLQPKTLSRTP
jgi:hypothetical protein